MPGGQPVRGGGLGAAGIDRCMIVNMVQAKNNNDNKIRENSLLWQKHFDFITYFIESDRKRKGKKHFKTICIMSEKQANKQTKINLFG